MSDEDSSSDDIPLSSIGNRRSKGTINYNEDDSQESEEAEFQDDDDNKQDGNTSDELAAEDGGDDEDEEENDDIPLSALKSDKSKQNSTTSNKVAAKSSLTKKKTPKKKETPVKKKSSSSKKIKRKESQSFQSKSTVSLPSKAANNYIAPSIELYSKCDKGKLIQSFLARWWYAYQWPDPASIPNITPKEYDALDGFPGVYICTTGSNVGCFKDYRDLTKAPSFTNFAKKNSDELKQLLLEAISKQKKVLIKLEGEGTDTEKELRELEKWVKNLNPSKVDKEAEKVLKAARLSLI